MPVFTIGYEGRSVEDFLTDLSATGVRLVADVREAPVSRKRGFSKSPLAQALHGTGIAYRHFGALGCPKPIREMYKDGGDWSAYTHAFMQHLAQQQPAIEELATLVQAQPTALLCYEADFNRCHRTYVARAVARHAGRAVWHITPGGLIEDLPPG